MRLALALYGEGTTDNRFLTQIILRTSRKILAEYGKSNINVASVEPITLFEKSTTREENILEAARQAFRYHALIVHSDADYPSNHKALNERILPGFRLVERSTEAVCDKLLPIIPVQAIEAWMLADYETLCMEVRTDLTAREVGIPEKAKQVEAISKPKLRLHDAVTKMNKQLRPQQRIDVSSLYEPLGRKIRLERLMQLSAYQQFVNDLTGIMKSLNLI